MARKDSFAAGRGGSSAKSKAKSLGEMSPDELLAEHSKHAMVKAGAESEIEHLRYSGMSSRSAVYREHLAMHREAIRSADAGMAAVIPHINMHIENLRREAQPMLHDAERGVPGARERLNAHLKILNPLERHVGRPVTTHATVGIDTSPEAMEEAARRSEDAAARESRVRAEPFERLQAVAHQASNRAGEAVPDRNPRTWLAGQQTGMAASVAGMGVSDATQRTRRIPGLSVSQDEARSRVDTAVKLAKARSRAEPGSDKHAELDAAYKEAHAKVTEAHPQGALGDLVMGISHLHTQRQDAIRAGKEVPEHIPGLLKQAHSSIAYLIKNANSRTNDGRVAG